MAENYDSKLILVTVVGAVAVIGMLLMNGGFEDITGEAFGAFSKSKLQKEVPKVIKGVNGQEFTQNIPEEPDKEEPLFGDLGFTQQDVEMEDEEPLGGEDFTLGDDDDDETGYYEPDSKFCAELEGRKDLGNNPTKYGSTQGLHQNGQVYTFADICYYTSNTGDKIYITGTDTSCIQMDPTWDSIGCGVRESFCKNGYIEVRYYPGPCYDGELKY